MGVKWLLIYNSLLYVGYTRKWYIYCLNAMIKSTRTATILLQLKAMILNILYCLKCDTITHFTRYITRITASYLM